MQRQLTAEDAPKIALALGLLLALCGVGLFTTRKAGVQREQERIIVHMSREMGVPVMDASKTSEEASQQESQEKDNQQEEASASNPNFRP